MVKKSAANKGNQAKAQAAPEAVPTGETAPLTPSQQAAFIHAQDAALDGNILTVDIIKDLSKGLVEDEGYEGEVFGLAEFDVLVQRGLMVKMGDVYRLKTTAMDLTPVETDLISQLRKNDMYGVLDYMMAITQGKTHLTAPARPKEPDYELISFRAPDPAQRYGYDYGDSIMPHEQIAVEIFRDLCFYTDLPRRFTVGGGDGGASDFIETIIGAMEGAFKHIEAIELAQLVVALQRAKDE